ncbi:type II secretion system F family protein [Nocardioides sediminis]|uniref:type II secretion system F family protein n=1 Tax=Nocardioides sediminis TaxID=433648 RepID=UPI000D320F15|nr:type II secretion system F family protein [Nocardioides sediminis]
MTGAWWLVAALAAAAAWLACPGPTGSTTGGRLPAPSRRVGIVPALAVLAGTVTLATAGVLPARLLVLAVIGGPVLLGARQVWLRRRVRVDSDATARHVLDACEVVAAELAAGRPPDAALTQAARRWPGIAPVVEAHALGSDVAEAFRRLAATPGADELRVVGSAWQVSQHSGHGLADALGRVAARIRARRQTRRVVTSELASARATARLVAVLPVVALGMGSGAGGDPWTFLLGTSPGWACLALGLGFGLLGLWWIEVIADAVDRP